MKKHFNLHLQINGHCLKLKIQKKKETYTFLFEDLHFKISTQKLQANWWNDLMKMKYLVKTFEKEAELLKTPNGLMREGLKSFYFESEKETLHLMLINIDFWWKVQNMKKMTMKKSFKSKRKKMNCSTDLSYWRKRDKKELTKVKIQEMKRRRNEREKKDERKQKN